MAVGLLGSAVLWILVPVLLLGWRPVAIVSDSMRPALHAGDVMLADTSGSVALGSVVVADMGSHLLTHRVIGLGPAGTYLTQGDANLASDSTPIAREAIRGRGRLVVPYLGLPWAWAGRGAWAAFADTTANSANALGGLTVLPPASLSATAGCDLVIIGPKVDLAWTETSTVEADGYQVLRSGTAGGPYGLVATITSRSTTSYTDKTVVASTTYYYVVTATAAGWSSANSGEASATTPLCV
jgi:signal peptidase I